MLVVASAGNSAEEGNPVEYPAAALGGRGRWLERRASASARADPTACPRRFSTPQPGVSLAAPGAGAGPVHDGVYSTIPRGPHPALVGRPCDRIFAPPTHGAGRYAYGEGTSFSAPLVAGAAALVRQARPGMSAPQVADVLRRSARQTVGQGWNELTGRGRARCGRRGRARAAVRPRRTDPLALGGAGHRGRAGADRLRRRHRPGRRARRERLGDAGDLHRRGGLGAGDG